MDELIISLSIKLLSKRWYFYQTHRLKLPENWNAWNLNSLLELNPIEIRLFCVNEIQFKPCYNIQPIFQSSLLIGSSFGIDFIPWFIRTNYSKLIRKPSKNNCYVDDACQGMLKKSNILVNMRLWMVDPFEKNRFLRHRLPYRF